MIWMDIGKRIKALRQNRNLTQKQFGELLGISRQHVSKIEKGQRLSIDKIDVICKKTGVTIEYIIYGITNSFDNLTLLNELSPLQIDISFDILKKLAEFVKTPNGNQLIINEIMRRQHLSVE